LAFQADQNARAAKHFSELLIEVRGSGNPADVVLWEQPTESSATQRNAIPIDPRKEILPLSNVLNTLPSLILSQYLL
jgi:hypothetical protein